MLRKRWLATCVALLIFAASWFAGVQLALAAEGEVSLGAGVNYTSGTYDGSATTHILTIPFTARYEREAWTLRAYLPYLRITGPGNVIPGIGPIGTVSALSNSVGLPLLGGSTASQPSSKTVSGLGDASVAATYMYYMADKTAGVGLTGRIKFATGDETRKPGTGRDERERRAKEPAGVPPGPLADQAAPHKRAAQGERRAQGPAARVGAAPPFGRKTRPRRRHRRAEDHFAEAIHDRADEK